MRILVTGGAGFIGSHLVDALVRQGHSVRIFDNIDPVVHLQGKVPSYLNKEAEFIKGDVRDYDVLKKAVESVEIVCHLAAAVGLAQSLYDIKRYVDVNIGGTANLLDILANHKHDVKKIVVPGSMSSYGEGAYVCRNCGEIRPLARSEESLNQKIWDIPCPQCHQALSPRPILESDELNGTFIYSSTKRSQEEMSLIFGKTYHLPVTVLRYFSAFGPRQSLSNPYTGVVAIFLSRLMNQHTPVIYEDGNQIRDYISVHDIVRANIAVLDNSNSDYKVFNVGSGKPITIKDLAHKIIKQTGSSLKPEILNKGRKGDIRHCYADISLIRREIGWSPSFSFDKGLEELMEWAKDQQAIDSFDQANQDLKKRGLWT